MEAFELAILFTAAGALVGAGVVKAIASVIKSFGFLPEHGRIWLVATAILAAGLIGLALLDIEWLGGDDLGQDILVIILAWLNIYTSAVGVHETAVKVQDVVSGNTNPSGPDN